MKITASARHGEYMIDSMPGLTVTEVWPTEEAEEDRWDWDDTTAHIEYRNAVPDGPAIDDPTWEHVVTWEGDREAVERGLTALIETIDCAPGGDDDTFDYWPSGVIYAADIADVLGGDWPAKVEEVARRVVADYKSDFAEELLSKTGYFEEES